MGGYALTADDLMMGRWRDKNERAVLVERVVRAEKAARLAEEKCRALMGDEDRLTVMAARIVELEDIVAKLNAKIARRSA